MTVEQEIAVLTRKAAAQEALIRQALNLAAKHARRHIDEGADPFTQDQSVGHTHTHAAATGQAAADHQALVTVSGTPDYITLSTQDIVRGLIVLTTDVSGVLPEANLPNASVTAEGVVELATTAEINTGTDSTRAMPVDQYVASLRNVKWITIRLVAGGTDVAVGAFAFDWVCPFTGTLLQDDDHKELLMAYNDTAGTTGTMVVDIHKGGTTIMTTNKLDIETGEKNTRDATTQPDLTTTAVTKGDIFTFEVDAKHTTAAKGLSVQFAIRLT